MKNTIEILQTIFGKDSEKIVAILKEYGMIEEDIEKLKKWGIVPDNKSKRMPSKDNENYNLLGIYQSDNPNSEELNKMLRLYHIQTGMSLKSFVDKILKDSQNKTGEFRCLNRTMMDSTCRITVSLGGKTEQIVMTERERTKLMALDRNQQIKMLSQLMPGNKMDELGEKGKNALLTSINHSLLNLPEPSIFNSEIKSSKSDIQIFPQPYIPNANNIITAYFDQEITLINAQKENIKSNLNL